MMIAVKSNNSSLPTATQLEQGSKKGAMEMMLNEGERRDKLMVMVIWKKRGRWWGDADYQAEENEMEMALEVMVLCQGKESLDSREKKRKKNDRHHI